MSFFDIPLGWHKNVTAGRSQVGFKPGRNCTGKTVVIAYLMNQVPFFWTVFRVARFPVGPGDQRRHLGSARARMQSALGRLPPTGSRRAPPTYSGGDRQQSAPGAPTSR